ncbi:hypothetical protein SARC_09082 [Sphaeroforma arctica JP610]|uniref:Uncharacterized protein n=1 Tax=Sphaeroforma arctica JP610 TaxID=667725 RepID=A0A0L0FP22_9EUKA|nr:hypothetical protein SARC_09082 [Sphaeroforma arctica JP610]KNC78489.1 hypothetical protein SARC_09082 [Sphaeroforma arctica JP610]|eukprot:XP_014152391.1 hypothetical protein SARC_09082 [Sphaeroforma arctica JP610]
MVAACNRLGLNGVAERKMYSRDWGCVGIVKIQLYNSNGAPLRSDIPNRKSLYLLLAKNIKESPRTPREEVELPKPITVQTAPTSEKAIKKKQKKQKAKMIRA